MRIQKHLVVAVSCLFFMMLATALLAQVTDANQPPAHELGAPHVHNYSPKEYNEHSQNWWVTQDERGVLYFANGDGLLEFDGVLWRLIKNRMTTRGRSLDIAADGTIFAGMEGDFGFLGTDSTGSPVFVSLLEELDEDDRNFTEVWRAFATRDGAFFQAFSHLFRWSGGKMHVWPSGEGLFFLSHKIGDTVYVEHRIRGLFKVVGDSLVQIGGRPKAPLGVCEMLPLGGGRILVCTRRDLRLLQDNWLIPFRSQADSFIAKNALSSAALLPDGTIVLGTFRGGIAIIDTTGTLKQVIDESSGLQTADVKHLFVDREHNLWAALKFGIARITWPSPFTYLSPKQGLKGLTSAITRYRGQIVSAGSQGMYTLAPVGETPEVAVKPKFKRVSSVGYESFALLDVDGRLIIGSGGGIYELRRGSARLIAGQTEGSFVLHRSRQDANVLFVGHDGGVGVLRLQDGKWVSLGRLPGVTADAESIVEPTPGTLWIGSGYQGVVKATVRLGKTISVNAEIFGEGLTLPTGQVFLLEGQPLFSTDEGLKRFDETTNSLRPDSTFGAVVADTTLSISAIFKMAAGHFLVTAFDDKIGHYWLAIPQEGGGFRLDTNTFRPILEFGTIYSSFPEESGVTWFGCNTGIVRYDPAVATTRTPSQPLIRRLTTIPDGSVLYGGSGKPSETTLPYEINSLRFGYTLPSFIGSSRPKYQYLLEGFDRRWSDWTHETRKEYTNLTEGSYRFRVIARNVYEHTSSEGVFDFSIQPPWYRSWWAYGLYILFFIAAVFGLVQLGMRGATKREQAKARLREAEITQQKDEELKAKNALLKAAQLRLTQSELRFRSVAQSANDGIISSDSSGRITFWNKCAEAIFGYSEKEALGRPLTVLMPERYREAHKKGLLRFISTGRSQNIGKILELDGLRKDGSEFPLELTLGSWQTDEGQFVTGILRDVSKRKQDQEELEKTQVRLFQSEKLASLGKLTAGIAHEMNTPIGVIKSNADVAARCIDRIEEILTNANDKKAPGDEPYKKFLNTLKENNRVSATASNRIASVVNSLKNFIRLDEADFQKVDLHEGIDSALALLEIETKDRIEVVREYGEIPSVEGHPGDLNQLFMNLLRNAIQAIDGPGTITLRTFAEQDLVHVQVTDTGRGIPSEKLEGLFEPAFAKKESRVQAGLGLYISSNIVQKHNGKIAVASEPGKGSTFTVSLPASRAQTKLP